MDETNLKNNTDSSSNRFYTVDRTESKILPLTKKHKQYDDVPDGLKWAIPIHECLEKPEVKARSQRLEVEAKIKVEKEFKEIEQNKRLNSIRSVK